MDPVSGTEFIVNNGEGTEVLKRGTERSRSHLFLGATPGGSLKRDTSLFGVWNPPEIVSHDS